MRAYVHHMLVYLCITPLDSSNVGESGSCDGDAGVSSAVRRCLSGLLIAAWAVGGEVFVHNLLLCVYPVCPLEQCAIATNVVCYTLSAF